MREFREVAKKLEGDISVATTFMPQARKHLGALKRYMEARGLKQNERTINIGDVTITVRSAFGQDSVHIIAGAIAGEAKVEKEDLPRLDIPRPIGGFRFRMQQVNYLSICYGLCKENESDGAHAIYTVFLVSDGPVEEFLNAVANRMDDFMGLRILVEYNYRDTAYNSDVYEDEAAHVGTEEKYYYQYHYADKKIGTTYNTIPAEYKGMEIDNKSCTPDYALSPACDISIMEHRAYYLDYENYTHCDGTYQSDTKDEYRDAGYRGPYDVDNDRPRLVAVMDLNGDRKWYHLDNEDDYEQLLSGTAFRG